MESGRKLEPPRLAWVRHTLRHTYAPGIAVRYGSPVYLVGGALTEDDPRDWDVRVVLSEQQYRWSIGDPTQQWEWDADAPGVRLGRTGLRLAYAELKHSRNLSSALDVDVDFKFIEEIHRDIYLRPGEFERIDGLPDWVLASSKKTVHVPSDPGLW